MAKLILGVAGEMGSGKEAVSKHLVNTYSANSHNFSQILKDILERLHLDVTRENFAPLSLVRMFWPKQCTTIPLRIRLK